MYMPQGAMAQPGREAERALAPLLAMALKNLTSKCKVFDIFVLKCKQVGLKSRVHSSNWLPNFKNLDFLNGSYNV